MKPFQIHPEATIAALNHLIATHLPYLQLRVFDQAGALVTDADNEVLLADLIAGDKPPVLTVRPSMTVAELEQLCLQQWGLRVEVYRRNGYLWADTDYTKAWTLREQSHKGERIFREED